MHSRVFVCVLEDLVGAVTAGAARDVRGDSDGQPAVLDINLSLFIVAIGTIDGFELALVCSKLRILVAVLTIETVVYGPRDHLGEDDGGAPGSSAVAVLAGLGLDLLLHVCVVERSRFAGLCEVTRTEQQQDEEEYANPTISEPCAAVFCDNRHGGYSPVRRLAIAM
jgi:hypothetical protein